ncbi:MAG: AAA family ATPase [Actinomycetota bacterium]|nr:AAA family ATPase [Actinomycetota bacterium]
MIIKGLKLKNFRAFTEREFSFGEGLNLVRGRNEAGKSTLVRAILAAFFEKANAKNERTRADRCWQADSAPRLELWFEDEGEEYHLIKDFEEKREYLERKGDQKKFESAKGVEGKLAEIIGFEKEDDFLRTVCVTHDQMTSLASDVGGAGKLASMLREVVIGGSRADIESALKKLDAEINELERGLEKPAKNPGEIKKLEVELDSKRQKKEEIQRELGDFRQKEKRYAQVKDELLEREKRCEELRDLIEGNKKILSLKEKMESESRRFDQESKILAAHEEMMEIQQELESFPFASSDTDKLEEITGERQRMKKMEEQKAVTEKGLDEAQSQKRTSQSRWGWTLLALGIIFAVAGIVFGVTNHYLFFLLVLPAIALVLWAAKCFSAARRGLLEKEQQLQILERDREEIERREKEILSRFPYESFQVLEGAYSSFKEAMRKKELAEAGFKALIGERDLEEVKKARSEAALRAEGYRAELERMGRPELDAEKLVSYERELEELEGKVEELRREGEELSSYFKFTDVDSQELTCLEEEIHELEEKLDDKRRRLEVLKIAREAMEETSKSMLEEALPSLRKGICETFSKLTGGRYEDVEVSRDNLAISVYSREKGGMVSAEELLGQLSKGTVSQLYLSARLELSEILSGNCRPPLIFDDSFSYFDDERLSRLWEILQETARERQTFVFTCTSRYDSLIDEQTKVIDIG